MAEFKIENCKDKGAYSAKPLKNLKLDLDKIRKEYKVIKDAKIGLVIKDKYEIVVYEYGEIMFKGCSDMHFMERTARKIYDTCTVK